MMDWSGRSVPNLANSMLIREGNTVDALMTMLMSSCTQPRFRGFEERLSEAELKRPLDVDGLGDDDLTDHQEQSSHVEKKRRLTVEQVRCLEKRFEVENKLEPERKLQLATELGLEPRQIAVWFQNRRARWRTKQLEQDYDILKKEYESLLQEKQKLQVEVVSLTDQLIAKEAKTKCIKGDISGSSQGSSQQEIYSDMETSLEAENQATVSCKLYASSPIPEKALNCIDIKPSMEECSPKSDGYNSEVMDVGSPNPVDTGLDHQQSTEMAAEQHMIAAHALGTVTYHSGGEEPYGTVYNNTQMYGQIACKLEDGLFYEDHAYHYCNTPDEAAFPAWWYCP